MDESTFNYLKSAVEAILFVSDKPVTVQNFVEALETADASVVKDILSSLQAQYEREARGMVLAEIAGGYQMLSSPSFAEYIRNFYKTKQKERLSQPSLETLAIIAYKQPVSRMDVEQIRGVNSDGVVTHLLEKGLIKIAGRKEVPGRPYLYGTTKEFLEYFGLKSLADLPKLEEFPRKPLDQPVVESGVASQETVVSESSAEEFTANLIRENLAQAAEALQHNLELPVTSSTERHVHQGMDAIDRVGRTDEFVAQEDGILNENPAVRRNGVPDEIKEDVAVERNRIENLDQKVGHESDESS